MSGLNRSINEDSVLLRIIRLLVLLITVFVIGYLALLIATHGPYLDLKGRTKMQDATEPLILASNQELRQSIIVTPQQQLTMLNLCFGTFQRTNTALMKVTLLEDEAEISSWLFPASQLVDNEMKCFQLETPYWTKNGAEYSFTVYESYHGNNAVAVWMNGGNPIGHTVDGVFAEGIACYSLEYKTNNRPIIIITILSCIVLLAMWLGIYNRGTYVLPVGGFHFNGSTLFFMLTLGVGFAAILQQIIHPGNVRPWLLFVDSGDSFMDFFNPIIHSYAANPYTSVDRIYPAFCYVFYWILSRFVSPDLLQNNDGKALRATQEGLFLFSIYTAITIVILAIALNKLYTKKKTSKILFFIAVLFSAPFAYQYDRANIILLAFSLLCLFYTLKDSKNALVHELSLILLCISACIKLYPAIFGILLLRDRKWKDIVHCLIYGLILLLLPFMYMGGPGSFWIWIQSLTSGASGTLSVTQGVGYKVNFANTIATLYGLTHQGVITEGAIRVGGKIALILTAFSLLAVFLQKREWKLLALLCCIIVGFPGFSFQYCMIFMVIPLAVFLQEESRNAMDYLYAVLFSMMMMLAIFPRDRLVFLQGIYPMTVSVFLEEIAILVMTVLLIIDTAIGFFSCGRKGKRIGIDAGADGTSRDVDLVSICIPVYNSEKTIRNTLESAINQTYPNLEIIVVDNCSTDGTMDILREIHDPRTRIYQNSVNLGMVGNWNKCLEYAQGEYIMILCSDDIIESDCIEKKMRVMNSEENIVLTFGASEVINENDEVLLKRRLFKHSQIIDGRDLALRSYYSRNLYGEPSNVLFKKSILENTGEFDPALCYATDWHMWLRLSGYGKVGYASDVLMKYRVSSSNQTSKTKFADFVKDDLKMTRSLCKDTNLNLSLFDDIIHKCMYIFRIFARNLFLKLKT